MARSTTQAPAGTAVYKFGGSALGDADAFRHAAHIVSLREGAPTVVVASAVRGTTDELLAAFTCAAHGDRSALQEIRERLASRHGAIAGELGSALLRTVHDRLHEAFDCLTATSADLLDASTLRGRNGEACPSNAVRDAFIATGERISAAILCAALNAQGVQAELVDPVEVIYTDGRHGNAWPNLERCQAAAQQFIVPLLRADTVAVVPGFLGRGIDGQVVTLGRGGSDLTATILGRALHAHDIVLWKDVPGLLTADPRVVEDARVIPTMDIREAAELAHYGAKVLHPRALTVVDDASRVFIRPFTDPGMPGTQITVAERSSATSRLERRSASARPVKALSVITNQALVMVIGNGMLEVPGVAARTFTALQRAGASASLISQASSEHSICFSVPSAGAADVRAALRDAFAPELERSEIEDVVIRDGFATISVVGLGMAGTPGVAARLFTALADAKVNIVAIAQGASELSISVVVDSASAATAQRAIHGAFKLEKVGGGTAARSSHADVVLLGFGRIGRAFTEQLRSSPDALDLRVVAVLDRQGCVFDPRGISDKKLAALATGKTKGVSLADAPGGRRMDAMTALREISTHALSRPILVDLTAGDTGEVLAAAVTFGMDLVLANKWPLAGEQGAAEALVRSATERGRRVLHEATVGAGLPIIDTLHKLVESGDRVIRIEGCPSGTLGYLFGEMDRGVAFSDAVRGAMDAGYTEPDPRDDLSGMDVARKGLILGRLIGYTGELSDVRIESLVPGALRDVPLDVFLDRLNEFDAAWARRIQKARKEKKVLRYRTTVTKRSVRVGIVAVESASALGALTGTDNQFSFTTARYKTNPLVITGPGAGSAVTAAGVLNDVLKVARAR